MQSTQPLLTIFKIIFLSLLSASALAGPVNVNTADAETIAAELDGIGITKARAIIAYRNANGPFQSVESLAAVTGIGERTLAINSANILLVDSETEREADE